MITSDMRSDWLSPNPLHIAEPLVTTNKKSKSKPKPKPKQNLMKLITVHGIRAQNMWWEDIESMDILQNETIKVLPFNYGFFKFHKFIRKGQRDKIIDAFCTFYSDNFSDSSVKPSVIAHSFGTLIVLESMRRYESVKFDNIILCGSVLNSNTNFRDLIEKNQFNSLINDYGKKDWFLKYTRVISKHCGKAGKVGFHNIPPKYKTMITNRENYSRHSDYFLPINMQENWIKPIVASRKYSDFNSKILRPEVIERIYLKTYQGDTEFKINNIGFYARIDSLGNYFAKYHAEGLNETNHDIDNFIFTTSADGMHSIDKMGFRILDESNQSLDFDIDNDHNHLKSIKVRLQNTLKPKNQINNKLYFSWYNTINLIKGDTDHWNIQGIKNVKVQLNFPNTLKSPRIYVVKEYEIINRFTPEINLEKDNTTTYTFTYTNENNSDGLIFYFEGIEKLQKKHKKNRGSKVKKIRLSKNEVLHLEKATIEEVVKIYKIESEVEHSNAASEQTLSNRISMFNEGFLVLKNRRTKEVIGYIETIIWNDKEFSTFKEMSNFPMHYNVRGNSMYVIFIAIKEDYRKQGLAKRLISEVESIAKSYDLKKITLVAKDDLIDMYEKFGYQKEIELPDFLENNDYKSMRMVKMML